MDVEWMLSGYGVDVEWMWSGCGVGVMKFKEQSNKT